MPQANSHHSILAQRAASRRTAYERDAIAATLAMFFQPALVPTPANSPAAPARMMVNPQADGTTIMERARRHPDFARLGVNALPRCEWKGQCRPDGAGICLDCGLTIGEVR